MSQVMQYEFRLFGPRSGQTVVINGHRFVEGKAVLVQSSENMGACMRVLSFYDAFAKGSPDYDKALAKEEAANGPSEINEKAQSGSSDSVRSDAGSDGDGPTEEKAAELNGNADTDAGSAGSDSAGDGHEHAGIPKFEAEGDRQEPVEPSTIADADVASAVSKLDPEVNSHWVITGKAKGLPKLNAVEDALGRAGLTRKDVESALPGWNRDTAKAAAKA